MAEQKVAFKIDSECVDKVLKNCGGRKYFDLVWAARTSPIDANAEVWEEQIGDPVIRQQAKDVLTKIVEKYPEEYKELKDPANSDFWHGFNSGCLAMSRWFDDAFDNEFIEERGDELCSSNGVHRAIERAHENFPSLDT